ncbi:hypothetical protein BU16DRAFT_576708 [Lophium mytilinum]|uniref:Uncharacterized protein n=1 Tax=Lophium mytilinum TaxID=390894 RepID=A0A6A6RED6_9PEZI|nr:hypothetical protein BU16DRAFT_576708 [Lophium mytilinum]
MSFCRHRFVEMGFFSSTKPGRTAVGQRAQAVRRSTSTLLSGISTSTIKREPKTAPRKTITRRRLHFGHPTETDTARENWMWMTWLKISKFAVKQGVFSGSEMDTLELIPKVLCPGVYDEVLGLYDILGEHCAEYAKPSVVDIDGIYWVFFNLPKIVRDSVDVFKTTPQYKMVTPLRVKGEEPSASSSAATDVFPFRGLPPTPPQTPAPDHEHMRIKEELGGYGYLEDDTGVPNDCHTSRPTSKPNLPHKQPTKRNIKKSAMHKKNASHKKKTVKCIKAISKRR